MTKINPAGSGRGACHHIPAKSFEAILKQFPARYLLGLTATPYRKDGLEKILFQQCGPIRHTMESIDGGFLTKSAEIFETGFMPPNEIGQHPPYHVLIHCLVQNKSRNKLIVDKIINLISEHAFPLVLSDRKDHLDVLQKMLQEEFSSTSAVAEIVRLDGDSTTKQRRNAIEQINTRHDQSLPVVFMSTGALIGEGFDLPQLDALVLTTPLSFEGRTVQYAGRIHRLAEGKTSARIVDFVDSFSGMLVNVSKPTQGISKNGILYSRALWAIGDPKILRRKKLNKIEYLKWRGSQQLCKLIFIQPVYQAFTPYYVVPLFKNKFFIQQKYVVEGLSAKQIAKEIFSSKMAVLDALMKFGIMPREPHYNHGHPSQPRYGQHIQRDILIKNSAEQKIIVMVRELHEQGFSLRKIARILNRMRVATKCHGKSWHPEMVRRILDARDN